MANPQKRRRLHCLAHNCNNQLSGQQRKYCSASCRNRYNVRKHRLKKQGLWDEEMNDDTKVESGTDSRRGAVYDQIKSQGWDKLLLNKNITQNDVASYLGCTQTAVARAVKALQEDLEMKRQHGRKNRNVKECPELRWDNIDELVEHFVWFRGQYFQTPFGEQYETPPHQLRWLRALLETLVTGGKLLILSPPRHGKTELLAHINTWLIVCVNRNIRIMQVGGNQEIAENSSGLVKSQLEDNEQLEEDWTEATEKFKPSRGGPSWTEHQFTIGCRTIPGIKSPTMVAVGRGGKILSRDADMIVVDDIEDDDSTHTPTSREKTRRWWGITVGSRKEEHTALVVIGSRQHPDDLYGHLLEQDGWRVIVEQAQD